MHLKELSGQLDEVLSKEDLHIDDATRAHLEESRDTIAKVLSAEVQSSQP